MNTKLLTHVVPTLPPHTGGAGEYAFNLACQLRDQYGINSQFILCDPNWDGPARMGDFVIRRLRLPNEAGLWSLLATIKNENGPPVLLHYDGYAYHQHGTPAWLYRGLKSWLDEGNHGSAQGRRQFATVFHELWQPSTNPWERRFYLQTLQKRLVEKLHLSSQYSITNNEHHQAQLESIEAQKTWLLPTPGSLPITERPVFKAGNDEPLSVAIFCESIFRSSTVRAHSNLLRALEKANQLDRVMLIGQGDPVYSSIENDAALLQKNISAKRIEILGELNPEQVALAMSQADLLLFPFGGKVACKTASFMAALATGCVAVLRDGLDAAPLQERKHFIASNDSPASVKRFVQMISRGEIGRIAIAGRTWYQRYADWIVIAQKYRELLQGRMPVEMPRQVRWHAPLWSRPARHAD